MQMPPHAIPHSLTGQWAPILPNGSPHSNRRREIIDTHQGLCYPLRALTHLTAPFVLSLSKHET